MTVTTSAPAAFTDSFEPVTFLSSATRRCVADIGPDVMPDAVRHVPNAVELADDPIYPPRSHIDCLNVELLGLTLPNGRQLVSDVSFSARPGSLTAIIGPSGAGKSTLAKLVGGAVTPTDGAVSFDGHDLHAEYASLRHRIGLVPQDDVVHHQLTVAAALGYAAELRLPHATKEERSEAVSRVLGELELTSHVHTRIDKLSGGQRKRASVAMELLTGPSLLVLDEPTTGLDPALDRQVMTMLRRLADAGRVVLVVTHCLTYLDVCDQVLFLAPGGKTAYCGPPRDIGAVLGSTDWADIVYPSWRRPRSGPSRLSDPLPFPPRHGHGRQGGAADHRQPRPDAGWCGRCPPWRAVKYGSSWPIGAICCSWRCCRSSSACSRCWCPARLGWVPPTRAIRTPTRRRRSSCCSISAPCSWAPR